MRQGSTTELGAGLSRSDEQPRVISITTPLRATSVVHAKECGGASKAIGPRTDGVER